MNRIIMTAIAAATFGSAAYATTATTDTLMTRSEPATITVFERDSGINGSQLAFANAGTPMQVDADLYLGPRDQALAEDGQITVYTFTSAPDNNAVAFSPR